MNIKNLSNKLILSTILDQTDIISVNVPTIDFKSNIYLCFDLLLQNENIRYFPAKVDLLINHFEKSNYLQLHEYPKILFFNITVEVDFEFICTNKFKMEYLNYLNTLSNDSKKQFIYDFLSKKFEITKKL